MKTMQEMVKRDIQKYIDLGYSIDAAAKQVKALRLNNWNTLIEQVAAEMKAKTETE